MKPEYYGAIAGGLTPLILMATDYLPSQEGNELRTVIASVVVGLALGFLIKLSEFIIKKIKQN